MSPVKGESPAPFWRYERSKLNSKSTPINAKSVIKHNTLEALQSIRAPQKDSIHNLIYDSKFFDSVFDGEDKDYIKRKNLLKNQLKKNFPVDGYLKNHYNKRHMYVCQSKNLLGSRRSTGRTKKTQTGGHRTRSLPRLIFLMQVRRL
jgi:hypothetical protein